MSTKIEKTVETLKTLDESIGDRKHYYYSYQPTFTKKIEEFAKMHQYDNRKIFQCAWTEWKDVHKELIEEEISYLTRLEYQGDILDKMYKSARFYYRKKSIEQIENEKNKNKTKERCPYTKKPKVLLEDIDVHLKTSLNLKPEKAFESFWETIELKKYESALTMTKEDIKNTYKNRYYRQLRIIRQME